MHSHPSNGPEFHKRKQQLSKSKRTKSRVSFPIRVDQSMSTWVDPLNSITKTIMADVGLNQMVGPTNMELHVLFLPIFLLCAIYLTLYLAKTIGKIIQYIESIASHKLKARRRIFCSKIWCLVVLVHLQLDDRCKLK